MFRTAMSVSFATFALATVASGAYLYGALQPPITYLGSRIVEDQIVPGGFATIEVRAIWTDQCPSQIYIQWTEDDKARTLVQRLDPIAGGNAPSSNDPQTRRYRHRVPEARADGSPLPPRICFQSNAIHQCGLFQTKSNSPYACASVASF